MAIPGTTTSENPKTLGDLVEKAKSVLTEQAQNELEKAVRDRYGIGALTKARENITEGTRNELTSLVSGLPTGQEILAKLDPYLPGGAEASRKTPDTLPKESSPSPNVAPIVATAAGAITVSSEGLNGVINESIVGLGKETEKIKKNPIGKIAEMLGFTNESIVDDFKEAIKEKKSGGFEGVLAGIKIWFYGFLAKMTGADILKSLSPEEIKLAGISPKNPTNEVRNAPEQKTETDIEVGKKKAYASASLILGELANKEAKQGGIASLYQLPDVQKLPIKTLKSMDTKRFREKVGVSQVSDVAIDTFLKPLTDTNHSLYNILSSNFSRANPGKDIGNATVYDVLASVGPGLKTLMTMKKIDITNFAESAEELVESAIKVDESGEVSGELVAQAEGLGISKNVLKVLLKNRGQSYIGKPGELDAILRDPSLSADDKSVIQKIGKFGGEFQNSLKTDTRINLGNSDTMKNIISNGGMRIGDTLKAYILTGGKSRLDEMSALEKVGAYTSFLMITGADPEGAGAITGSIINFTNLMDLATGASIFDKIPPDVRKIISENFSLESALKKVKNLAGGMYDSIAGFADKSQGFAAILIIAVLFLPVFSKRTNLASILTGRR